MTGKDSSGSSATESSKSPKFLKIFKKSKDSNDIANTSINSENGTNNKRMSNSSFNSNTSSIFRHKSSSTNKKNNKNRNSLNSDLTISSSKSFNNGSMNKNNKNHNILNLNIIPKSTSAPNIDHKLGLDLPSITPIRSGSRGASKLGSTARKLKHKITRDKNDRDDDDDDDIGGSGGDDDDDGDDDGIDHYVEDDDDDAYEYEDDDDDAEFNAQTKVLAGNEGNHILPISSATNALKNFTDISTHPSRNNTNGSLINGSHHNNISNNSLKIKDNSLDGLYNNKLQQKHSLHIPKFIISHADAVSERDSNQTDKQNSIKNSKNIDSIDKTIDSSDITTSSSNINQNSLNSNSNSNINSIHNANSTNSLKDNNNTQSETTQTGTGFISGLLNKLGSIGSPTDESDTSGNNNNNNSNNNNTSQSLLSSVLNSVTNHNNNSNTNINNALTTSSLLTNGDQQTEEDEKFTLVSDSTTTGLSGVGLHSAENISFQPIRQSLLSTLGQGGLSLDAFPSQDDQNEVTDDAGDLLIFSSGNGTPQININDSNTDISVPMQSKPFSNIPNTNGNIDTNSRPLLVSNDTLTPDNQLSDYISRNTRDLSIGNGGLSRYGQMNRSRATITESNKLDANGSNSSGLLNKRYSGSSHTINVANMDSNSGGGNNTGGYNIPNSNTSNTLNSHLTTSTAITGNDSVTAMGKGRSVVGVNSNSPQFNTTSNNLNLLQPNTISLLDEQLQRELKGDEHDASGGISSSSPPLSHPQPKTLPSGQHIQLAESANDNSGDNGGRGSRTRHRGTSILSSIDFSRTLSPFNEIRRNITSPVMSRAASPVQSHHEYDNSDDDDESQSGTEGKSPDVLGAAKMLHSLSVATTGRRKNTMKRLSAPQTDLSKSNRQSLEDGNGDELRKYFSNVTIDHTGTDKQDRINNKMEYLSNKLNIKLPSSKRQDTFKEVFEDMPYDEILIDDFACAYKKDILIQGRMYLTDKHICFHSKIIGLVKHFTIPFSKILEIKKKKTVGIPNALEFVTFHDKYSFASIINRDNVYDLIDKIWKSNSTIASIDSVHLAREDVEDDDNISEMESDLDDEDDDEDDGGNKLTKVSSSNSDNNNDKNIGNASMDMDTDSSISDEENMIKDIDGDDNKGEGGSKDDSKEEAADVFNSIKFKGPKQHAPTKSGYTTDSSDIKVIDDSIDAPLGVVFGLLFGDDTSLLNKIIKLQKNIEISDIPKFDSNTQTRNYSYVKPLGGPIGPKQTKCLINESIKKSDFEENCNILQTIETPDVPSGNAFKVLTKFYLSWGPNNSTKILIMTQVAWTGKSWIKGPVEKGSISGQQEALPILVSELKKRISEGAPKRKASTKPKSKHKKSKKSAKPAVEEEDQNAHVEVVPSKGNGGIVDIIIDSFMSIFNMIKSSLEMVNTMIPGPEYIKLSVEICLILYVSFKILIFVASFISFGSSRNAPRYGGYNDYGYGGEYGYNRNVPNRMFGNDYLLDRSEYDIWEWIDKRNAAYSDGYQSHSSGSNAIRDTAGESPPANGVSDNGSSVSSSKSNQEVEEMISLLEMRLAKLRNRLV